MYTFRDLAEPIFNELKRTSGWVLLLISGSAVIYELVEGWITCSFAKKYNPEFTYRMGVESAFYISFYRTATLGSGAGVAAVYYFNEKGIIPSKGTGMYLMEYVLHKISIAIFSAIFFVCNWSFMVKHYADYMWLLAGGYGITLFVAIAIVLCCCSKRFHRWVFKLAGKFNRNGRWNQKIDELNYQCNIMEDATTELLEKKKFVLAVILKNLLKFAFWYGIPYFVLIETGKINFVQTMAVTSLAIMLAAIIPSPAGIGSTEFVLTLLYAGLVGTGLAGSVSLLYRFATFVLPFIVGALIVLSRRKIDRQIRKIRQRKA